MTSAVDERPATARSDRRASLGWWALACVATLVTVVLRLVRNPTYYFLDDTQTGAVGQWYALGQRLLDGDWTILDPGAWQGGNLLVEGQWGLWNPLSWLVAIGSHAQDDAALYATFVKVVFLLVLTSGVFLLARTYGASAPWAAVAGFAVTLGGQTAYLDSPSWVTGLMGSGLFAWTWWAMDRYLRHGRHPWPFFVLSYLLVTVGYVAPVLMLIALFVAMLIAQGLQKSWSDVRRTLGLGVYSGLLVVFVFLPSVLTSSATVRTADGIFNTQALNMDLGDLAIGPLATGWPTVTWFGGGLPFVPVAFIAWFIPLLPALLLRGRRPELAVVGLVGLAGLLLVMGPSDVGPLRFQIRMMPYVVMAFCVAFAVLATKNWPRTFTQRDRWWARGLLLLAVWSGAVAVPANIEWVVLGGLVQAALLEWIMRRPDLTPARGVRLAAATVAVGALAFSALATWQNPRGPLPDFHVPESIAESAATEAGSEHGIFTVGNVFMLSANPDGYSETLLANSWYLTGKDAASVYTVVRFKRMSEILCSGERGETCPDAYERLFQRDGDDRTIADDMMLNTVVVMKDDVNDRPVPPDGWTLETFEHTWIVSRDEPVGRAGSVVHADGAEVTVESSSTTEVRFRVDEVTADDASVAFSRIAWPGYRVDGPASVGDPRRDFLLSVDLEDAAPGDVVTVQFRPPGWTLELASAAVALLIAAGWSVAHPLVRRRARRAPRPDEPAST
ncbi:hypothetical protein [Aeromicrobium sp. Leaf350]|uniref:hypothetical protein n=1 Tax=Aeromicrobium sp. Leaf350 TaxID=2876565 RepID=UPI001E418A83|nr:hypothetical protein [Aeromicrobium sp. Leaf350]